MKSGLEALAEERDLDLDSLAISVTTEDEREYFDVTELFASVSSRRDAALRGNVDAVYALHDADVHLDLVKDVNRKPILHIAASFNWLSVIEALVKCHASMDVEDPVTGLVALDVAALEGNNEAVEALLTHLANPQRANSNDGRACLHFAASQGHVDVIATLLRHGVDVNQKDHQGHTALAYAARDNQGKVVSALLNHGANEKLADVDGRIPRDFAEERGHVDIVRLLLQHGSDKNPNTIGGSNSSHLSSAEGTFAQLESAESAPNPKKRRCDTTSVTGPSLQAAVSDQAPSFSRSVGRGLPSRQRQSEGNDLSLR